MLPPTLFIFSAPVHSGKTSALMAWAEDRTDLGGFLAPDLEGVRHLFTLRDRRMHPFQVREQTVPSEELVTICRYHFSASTFALARQMLIEDALRPMPWLVVDEVGKLELQGLGHEPALSEVIRMHHTGVYRGKLLLVVRTELLGDVMEKYRLHSATVLSDLRALTATDG